MCVSWRHPVLRVAGLVLPLALAVGCAHQAVVASDPPGAEVYVNGEKVGVTPVSIEDAPGWSREYEITLRKEGYEPKQVTLEQDVWNTPALAAAGLCGACSCGLAAIYFLPRSRTLEDRYGYALKRKTPLPPLEEAPPSAPPTPSDAPAPSDADPAAPQGGNPPQPQPAQPAPAPGTLVPQSARGVTAPLTPGGQFRY